jgi:hypothetical protein
VARHLRAISNFNSLLTNGANRPRRRQVRLSEWEGSFVKANHSCISGEVHTARLGRIGNLCKRPHGQVRWPRLRKERQIRLPEWNDAT